MVADYQSDRRKKCAMTKKEFFEAIVAKTELEAELIEFAAGQIAKIDEVNAKNREKTKNGARKVSDETLAKRKAIVGAVKVEPQTAEEIGNETGYTAATVSGVLRSFVNEGRIVKGKTKVANAEGKMRELTTYALMTSDIGAPWEE